LVGDLLGPEHHLNRLGAPSLAAAFLQGDLRFQLSLLEFLPKGSRYLLAPHGQASGTAADQNLERLSVPAGQKPLTVVIQLLDRLKLRHMVISILVLSLIRN